MKRSLSDLRARARYVPYAIAIAMMETNPAFAQSAQSTESNSIQLIQYVVDVLIAGAGAMGLYFLIRAGMAISKTGQDSARERRGHNIISDVVAGVFLFAIGVIVYVVKTQIFGSGNTSPSLYAPSISPSNG